MSLTENQPRIDIDQVILDFQATQVKFTNLHDIPEANLSKKLRICSIRSWQIRSLVIFATPENNPSGSRRLPKRLPFLNKPLNAFKKVEVITNVRISFVSF